MPDEALKRFFVVGGECNYLFTCERVDATQAAADSRCAVRLVEAAAGWCAEHTEWAESEVTRALDVAEASLRATASALNLRCRVIRKDRAVGIIPGGNEAKARVPDGSGSRRVRRELLDETALRLQAAIAESAPAVPTCCFNGGADVWCDIGNKAFGVGALQKRIGVRPSQCLHVGDQFATSIGNDYAARFASPTLWVAGPKETQHVLKHILERQVRKKGDGVSHAPRAAYASDHPCLREPVALGRGSRPKRACLLGRHRPGRCRCSRARRGRAAARRRRRAGCAADVSLGAEVRVRIGTKARPYTGGVQRSHG